MTGTEVEQHYRKVLMVAASTRRNPRVSLKTLLEAGVHFGHQKNRWNPKMKPFIFTERNGIHILDLQQTVPLLEEAHEFVSELTAKGGHVLFVGTKKQAQDIVKREAERSGQYFVNKRWLGGTLTNFVTIRQRLRYLKQLQGEVERGELEVLPKREAASRLIELDRLQRTLGGMRDMTQLPGAVFIIDPKREYLAVAEAKRLGIKTIALVDSNSDPTPIDIVIPGNDDAIRSVRLIAAGIADAALVGRTERASVTGEDPDFGLAIEAEEYQSIAGETEVDETVVEEAVEA
jgi:small subunit ribosomal protein S2